MCGNTQVRFLEGKGAESPLPTRPAKIIYIIGGQNEK